MLSFKSNLSKDSDALAIFVSEKYYYKDKKGVLPQDVTQKINSFLKLLKNKKKEEDISSFDISAARKCLIIKIKGNLESYSPQEIGGSFFSYLKKIKDINKIDLYPDS